MMPRSAAGKRLDYTPGRENSKGKDWRNGMENFELREAVYLGVQGYGEAGVDREQKAAFLHRFQTVAGEIALPLRSGEMENYALQNLLKVGYPYQIKIQDGAVMEASETAALDQPEYEPPVRGTPGKRTLKNFLQTALQPVGATLYVFGGGWNWQDDGTAPQATLQSAQQDWLRFFFSQTSEYTYRDRNGDEKKKDPPHSFYPYGGFNQYYYAGLDCSGYVGWAVYHTVENRAGCPGYVVGANRQALTLCEKGWGDLFRESDQPRSLCPGDVCSMDGHVWISLGSCQDGSAVILHSTPSMSRAGQPGGGVQIGAVGESESCEAYALADRYMTRYYPLWHQRYPTALKAPGLYLKLREAPLGRFHWFIDGRGILFDPEGIQNMGPDAALRCLFQET